MKLLKIAVFLLGWLLGRQTRKSENSAEIKATNVKEAKAKEAKEKAKAEKAAKAAKAAKAEEKAGKIVNPVKPASAGPAVLYCCFAVILFCLQGFIANLGALDLVFPDLPEPVKYQAGRAVHLNLALYWTMIGALGAGLYFVAQESGGELFSPRLAGMNFWLLALTVTGTIGSLTFGLTAGREYLEAVTPFKIGFSLCLGLFLVNIAGTITKGRSWGRASCVAVFAGGIGLLLFYAPNIPRYSDPISDELVRFWVVHMWEEVAMEIISVGLIGALLITLTGAPRGKIEKLVYIDITLAGIAGIFGIGHHYYWVGTNGIWFWVGGAASGLQLVPILLLVSTAATALKKPELTRLAPTRLVTLGLLASSLFYHVFGAGGLGLLMSIPQLNLYLHGTFIVSAHAHLALFGTLGFLVLAFCHHILTETGGQSAKKVLLTIVGAGFLNAGLMIMASALLLAGLLQVYSGKIAGLTFPKLEALTWPYQILRGLGGMTYALGAVLFVWSLAGAAWKALISTTFAKKRTG